MSGKGATCPICGSTEFAIKFTVTREDRYAISPTDEACPPARYHECSRCRAMVWANPINYEHMYESGDYYAVDGDPEKFLAERFEQVINLPPERSDNVQRARRIKRFLEEEGLYPSRGSLGRVLDVGAGMGVFFHVFLDDGWKGTAIEPEPNARAHLERVLPEISVHTRYEDLAGRFDLVTMNRVLEHIADPVATLSALAPLLAPGGVMYLELPDVMSYFHAGPNDEAFGYEHYVVYSPNALLRLISSVGLEVLCLRRLVDPSGKFTIYAFAGRSIDAPLRLPAESR